MTDQELAEIERHLTREHEKLLRRWERQEAAEDAKRRKARDDAPEAASGAPDDDGEEVTTP